MCKQHTELSVRRQCKLLEVHRSGLYYEPIGESAYNLMLMHLIDQEFMKHPFTGVPRMTTYLQEDLGLEVNHKRVGRLYGLMDLQALVPGPNTSKPAPGHKVYPYLLRNLKVERSNQVWAVDITYIPLQYGFLYLVAIIDLYSRFVVGWSLNNTMSARWCADTLEEAIRAYGAPEILNSDQGSQFTSKVFTGSVIDAGIRMSMDGKGRAIDNVFIERLWRSLKYEHVYLNPANDGLECYKGIDAYFHYYNHQRRHTSIGKVPPAQCYEPPDNLAA